MQECAGADRLGTVGRAPHVQLSGNEVGSLAHSSYPRLQRLEREQDAEIERYRDEHVSTPGRT